MSRPQLFLLIFVVLSLGVLVVALLVGGSPPENPRVDDHPGFDLWP